MKNPETLFAATILAFSIASSGCGDETPEPIVKHGTAVDHGAALFTDPTIAGTSLNQYSCGTCHETGTADPSRILAGASLAGVTKRPSYWGGQELDLLRAINACSYYFMLKTTPYSAEDEEARALYAYLESISASNVGTEAVDFSIVVSIADLPAGDSTRGKGLYDRACAYCHGPTHTGKGRLVERAPILPEQTLQQHPLGQYTADEQRLVFVEKVRHGGFITYSGEMPPFASEKLSDAELADILQYLNLYASQP
ncbi:MAG TPA: c-type cytochrome [Polyangium sp.]|nr:c-type cytochrome [Polyangium sp.]